MGKARAVHTWQDLNAAGCVVCQETSPEGIDPTLWARQHVETHDGHATLVRRQYAYTTNPMMAAHDARIVKRLDGK